MVDTIQIQKNTIPDPDSFDLNKIKKFISSYKWKMKPEVDHAKYFWQGILELLCSSLWVSQHKIKKCV